MEPLTRCLAGYLLHGEPRLRYAERRLNGSTGHGVWTDRDSGLEKDQRFRAKLFKSGPDRSKRIVSTDDLSSRLMMMMVLFLSLEENTIAGLGFSRYAILA